MNQQTQIDMGAPTDRQAQWLRAAPPFADLIDALRDLAQLSGEQSNELIAGLIADLNAVSPEILVIGDFARSALQAAFLNLECYDRKETLAQRDDLRTLLLSQTEAATPASPLNRVGVELPPSLTVTFARAFVESGNISAELEAASARCDLVVYVHSATRDLEETAQTMIRALTEQHPQKTVLFIDEIDRIAELADRMPDMHAAVSEWAAAFGIEDQLVLRFGSSHWGSSPDDTAVFYELSGVPALLNDIATRVWGPMAEDLQRVVDQRAQSVILGLRLAIAGRAGIFADGVTPQQSERLVQKFEEACQTAQAKLQHWQDQLPNVVRMRSDAVRSTRQLNASIDYALRQFIAEVFGTTDVVLPPAVTSIAHGGDEPLTRADLNALSHSVETDLTLHLQACERILVDVVTHLGDAPQALIAKFGVSDPTDCLRVLDALADEFGTLEARHAGH